MSDKIYYVKYAMIPACPANTIYLRYLKGFISFTRTKAFTPTLHEKGYTYNFRTLRRAVSAIA